MMEESVMWLPFAYRLLDLLVALGVFGFGYLMAARAISLLDRRPTGSTSVGRLAWTLVVFGLASAASGFVLLVITLFWGTSAPGGFEVQIG